MSKAKIIIQVMTQRSGVLVTYRTTGLYRTLTVNDVRGEFRAAGLPGTGSRAFWEAVLTGVDSDIVAGNGGGS